MDASELLTLENRLRELRRSLIVLWVVVLIASVLIAGFMAIIADKYFNSSLHRSSNDLSAPTMVANNTLSFGRTGEGGYSELEMGKASMVSDNGNKIVIDAISNRLEFVVVEGRRATISFDRGSVYVKSFDNAGNVVISRKL